MAITVVHSKPTGHVLAVIDVNGPLPAPVPLAGLVGTALPIARSGELGAGHGPAEVLVPADQLGTAAADTAPGLLEHPMAYAVATGRSLVPLSPWSSGKPVELKTTGLVLTLDRTSVGAPTPVTAVVTGPAGTFTVSGQVFTGRKQTTVGVALTKGWYTVLTLAAGWHGRLEELEVS